MDLDTQQSKAKLLMCLSQILSLHSSSLVKKKLLPPFTLDLMSRFLSAKRELKIFNFTLKEALLLRMLLEEVGKILMMNKGKKNSRRELTEIF